MRVVVVGGGIAGVGAAWALHRSGAEVHLLEREPTLGGNAKTHLWQVQGSRVRTGLSVLAWPPGYFHTYGQLFDALGIPTEPTPPLRFFIQDGDQVWAHGLDTPRAREFAPHLAAWGRLVAWVRSVNQRFHADPTPSLYAVSPWNPLNLLPLRTLCRRFGVGDAFWSGVIVPIHSSSFLTVDLARLPAVIAPVLDDIMSLASGGLLRTWTTSSADVFLHMVAGFEGRVRVGCEISRVHRTADGVVVEGPDGTRVEADAVVLACAAPIALELLGEASWLERQLIGGITYPDDTGDDTFLTGVVHSDPDVLPAASRDLILQGYANAVTVHREAGAVRYENTFVISSWAPPARGADLPMLVTYGRRGAIPGELRRISNRRAHPELSTANLLRAMALRAVQGRQRAWYCGSWTTPGNGHDLSLLSGLVIADALGAAFPFPSHDPAMADFQRLRSFMLGGGDP